PESSTWLGQALKDFAVGTGAVLIVLLAIEIDNLGSKRPLEVGWAALGIALAGAAIAEWWSYALAGTSLTAWEIFQAMVAPGLPAASVSSLAILQPPGGWSEVLMLSQAAAAGSALVYHAANALRLARSGEHLGAPGAALIVGAPYVV